MKTKANLISSLVSLHVLLQNKVCSQKDDSFDVSKFREKFRLAAGQYTGNMTFSCNSGTSCFLFDIEFKRGK